MGYSTYDSNQWKSFQSSGASAATARKMASNRAGNPDFNPRNFKIRESCDSAFNPQSTPIAVIGDATGSMGALAGIMVNTGMATLAEEIHKTKPVTDPHLLFGVLGDLQTPFADPDPFQVTQFEADVSVAQQTGELFLGGCGGGGNGSESYHAAWYFGARRTRLDSVKRGKKGLLFTYGDEGVPPPLTPEQIKRVFGDEIPGPLSAEALLAEVSQFYDVYHLIVLDSGYCDNPARREKVTSGWQDLMGERAIHLTDHAQMAEVIVSLARIAAGEDADTVVNYWTGSTAVAVRNALSTVPTKGKKPGSGIVRF